MNPQDIRKKFHSNDIIITQLDISYQVLLELKL